MVKIRTLLVALLVLSLSFALIGCSGGGKSGGSIDPGVSPGMTFDDPSASAIMLPAPTALQQVQQPEGKPWCLNSAGLTLYRMITGKDKPLEQVVKEMYTNESGTQVGNFLNWVNAHEMNASGTMVPTTWAIDTIAGAIKTGHYVIPCVNANGQPNSPHALIAYGVDAGRVLLSDSNPHMGMNLIAIDTTIFEEKWLINYGTEKRPKALLLFVDSRPKKAGLGKQSTSAGASTATTYPWGELRIK